MVLAAAANERSSATFANIASPSKSGSFDIDNSATMTFIHFCFEKSRSATGFAGAAVFLASSDASFIAGTELFVDGGQAQI